MPRGKPTQEWFDDLHFPKAGVDRSGPFGRQPVRPVEGGDYARTCRVGVNCRGYEPRTNRARGGPRPGTAKWIASRPAGEEWVVQELTVVAGVGYPPPGGGMGEQSQSGRTVTVVAVSEGQVRVASPGDTAWTTPTNLTGEDPPLNFTGVMFSAANNQRLYFADGTNRVYYQASDNTLRAWSATAGTMPEDSEGNRHRLICTWRGRTVVSGLLKDPQNWFMSAVSDPTDWDYSPASVTPTQAVAGNNSSLGLIGDVVNSLIPYSDDVLLFGGDHTLYLMRGDPMAGGTIDLVSDTIGTCYGMPWVKDPYGNVWFVSNRPALYTMVPGQQPQRVSGPVEQLLQQINTGTSGVRLAWDDRFQSLHVYVTPLAAPAATQHFAYETRSGAFWVDEFADTGHDPLCCVTLDGNSPTDRVLLLGCWDGYVRWVNPAAADDDGTPIASEVWIGPLATKDFDDLLLKDVQAVLGELSGQVTYGVYVGATAEAALSSTPVSTGTWSAGRNVTNLVRRSGHAVYVRLTATVPWAMEAVRARLAGTGKVRRRAYR